MESTPDSATVIAGNPLPLVPRRVSFAAKTVASLALGLLLGGLVVAWIATTFMGYRVATVQSFSMRPTLDRGDLIFSRPANINDVETGDVITFLEGRDVKLLVAHRVALVTNVTTRVVNTATGETTSEESRILRTKGDANQQMDTDIVDASNFRGIVWFTIPNVGLLIDDIPLQYILISACLLTGIVWLGYEMAGRRTRSQPSDVPWKDDFK